MIKNNKLTILNGNTNKDKSGESTFMNRNGCSVIDYCLVSRPVVETDKLDFEIIESEQSCHFPIYLHLNRTY